ncbi:hypothetical protein HWV62_37454 [Athelia sp. TMB]|nr:hypothetical protein HWV62_37454 [Athelia sp. TMB]
MVHPTPRLPLARCSPREKPPTLSSPIPKWWERPLKSKARVTYLDFQGIRAWGRTGCDSDGSNCATGHCNGGQWQAVHLQDSNTHSPYAGLICTDAGINAGVIVSEYGYADFGAEWGGKRTSWDLSHVGLDINLDTSLKSSDGQSVKCTASSCPNTQAYSYSTDYAADRNSPLGHTYTHTFCA